jgi:amino acid transporter
MSRMWFAFARDDGMPGSGTIKKIHPRWRTPVNSILVTCVIAVLITAYSAAYFVVTSISTITLYLAYGIPIMLNFRNKRRKQGEYSTPETAPWSLKNWGPLINVLAIIWIVIITIVFILPPNELVLWTMVTLTLVMLVYWQLGAKKWFRGPKKASEEDLRRIEEELEALAHAHGDD